MNDYKTVLKAAKDEMIERKSRFIGYCAPVKNEDEAIAFINEVRAANREATHNVYAYVVRENNIMRYSDDGEPAGTAGVPVLEVIRKGGLTDICVVVTRYFGGVLLGAGGLVRAYGKGAKIGIDAAQRVNMLSCTTYRVACDYTTYGKVEYAVNNGGFISGETLFEGDVKMKISVRTGDENRFEKMIADISRGSAVCEKTGEEFTAVPYENEE